MFNFSVLNSNGNQIEMKPIEINKVLNELKRGDVETKNRSSVPNLIQCDENDVGSEAQPMKSERSQSLDPTVNLGKFDPLQNRVASRIISLGELSADAIICAKNERKNGKWYKNHYNDSNHRRARVNLIHVLGKKLLIIWT